MSKYVSSLVMTSADADWPLMQEYMGEVGSTISAGVPLSATGKEPIERRGTSTRSTDDAYPYLTGEAIPEAFHDRKDEWNAMLATLSIYIDTDTGETGLSQWEFVLQEEGMMTVVIEEPEKPEEPEEPVTIDPVEQPEPKLRGRERAEYLKAKAKENENTDHSSNDTCD